MLDSIRKRQSSFISSFIIIAVVAVMALYGIGGGAPPGSSGGAAAYVNGEIITNREFQQEMQARVAQFQEMFGAQYDENFIQKLQIPQRTLDELIQFKLLAQQAERLNIKVPDNELAEYIRSIPYYQKDGKFDAELYRSIPNIGLQEIRQRERLLLTKFQTYLSDRVQMTPAEVKDAYELRETKLDLAYVKIDFDAIAEKVTPPKNVVEKFLAEQPEEKFNAYYTSNKSEFTKKARIKISQIRVGIPFKASDEQKAKARKKIDLIANEVKSDTFAQVAKAQSDDEYAGKGGLVGWVDQGALERQLEEAAKKLAVGEVSPIVETSFGYFLLKLEDKEEEKVTPLEDVKQQIAEKLAGAEFRREYAENLKKEWNEKLSQGKPLAADFNRHDLKLTKTGPFSLGQGYVPNVGQDDAILDAVFALSMEKPEAPQLIASQDQHYFLKLEKVERAKPDGFEKDREVVEKSVETSLQTALVSNWISQLQENANIEKEVDFAGLQ